ncbi:MAG TPA: organic solvent tolerance protein OstA [Candidatus Avacidaminococcus intestinavium]|uniref:Organic solvent tolerance protein OstA n=1 Tax=Candidatus Avacidaminococcus intestinavium TaxID=2840684 RepID=A0A9D1MNM3_9FIRM|nr:organic solvent tolerance protein OstA [Candidatus Avacidaminococcus intestinavium]
MKKLFIAFLLIFLVPVSCFAKPTIKYDKQSFDPLRGIYYLEGNVSVDTGSRLITADQAQVELYSLEVHAYGNITLTQDSLVFTGDEVHVYGKNKNAVVTGDIAFSDGTVTINAEQGSFNWGNKDAHFTDNVRINAPDSAFTGSTQDLPNRRSADGLIYTDDITYNVRQGLFH